MCLPLHCKFLTKFSRRRRRSLILRSRNACDCCLPCRDYCTFQFLHRFGTSVVVNHLLQRSPNNIFHRIRIWVVWWSQCHVHVHCASGGVRRRAVFLQRPLVMDVSRTDSWPKTFSLLILTVDLGPWFHKQRLSVLCARCRPTLWCWSFNVALSSGKRFTRWRHFK